jgi:hypothetical protein
MATVAGAVTVEDQRDLVSFVRNAVRTHGEVGVLIWLERYTGSHHDARFDPDGLWNSVEGDGIRKIAIVGEQVWKIVPSPLHRPRAPIAYFPTEHLARRWLRRRAPRRTALPSRSRRAARILPFR